MFPSKTRADVGMVQCVAKEHGKPPGRKTVGTRRRAGPCKEEGQPVHAKPRSVTSLTLNTFAPSLHLATVLAVLLLSSFSPPAYCYAIMSVQ